jgi:hypothetical protein
MPKQANARCVERDAGQNIRRPALHNILQQMSLLLSFLLIEGVIKVLLSPVTWLCTWQPLGRDRACGSLPVLACLLLSLHLHSSRSETKCVRGFEDPVVCHFAHVDLHAYNHTAN